MMFTKLNFCRVFVIVLVFFSITLMTLAKKESRVSCQTEDGLHTVTLKTPKGMIHVKLPDDMTKRDVISGVVIVEPSGKKEKDRTKNRGVLTGYVVEIEDQKVSAGEKWGRWVIPSVSTLPLIFKDSRGKEVGKIEIPVHSEPPTEAEVIKMPTKGQAGCPVEVAGNFDGDFSSTEVCIGGVKAVLLAESPRRMIFESPEEIIGLTDIKLIEGDFMAEGGFRNVSVDLTAGKLKLSKGEQTEFTVTVGGLEKLEEEIPIHIKNESPAVISMEGVEKETIFINSGDVDEGGAYIYTRTISGIKRGNFSISATVFLKDKLLELVSPEDGGEVDALPVTFKWTPIDFPDVSYNFTIWELPEDLAERVAEGYKLTERDLTDIAPYFVKEGIKETSFPYPEDTDNPFVPWDIYYCQVAGEFKGHILKSKIQSFSITWESFGKMLWKTTTKCMKETGKILNAANSTSELPQLFKETSLAFQPLKLLLRDCPKKDDSHYMMFLEFASLLNSIGEMWEEGDMKGVSIQLENAGQIFDDAGGFPKDSELGSSFIEVGKSLHLFSGLTGLITNQQEIMTEMEELNEFYMSQGVDSIANMLNNLSPSDDPEIEQWMHNGCDVDVPEIDSYTPEMLDSTLTVFFNFFEESPHEFQNWLNETAMETSVLSAQELGMALGNMGYNMFLGIKLTCKNTCSPEGHIKEKVSVKVGLTKGNSQSAFIWLLAHAPKKSPGLGSVATLIPSVMKNLKKSLKKNVYARIWIKIEYYECKKTTCWIFDDELDWHKIKTVDWTLIKPPDNIAYKNPLYKNAWHGTKNWDKKTKKKIKELIEKVVKNNMPK